MGIITIWAENFILFIFSLMFRMISGIIFFSNHQSKLESRCSSYMQLYSAMVPDPTSIF